MPEPAHAAYGSDPYAYPAQDYPAQDYSQPQDFSQGANANANANQYSDVQRAPGAAPSHLAQFDPLAGSDFSISGRPTGNDAGAYAQAAAFRY
jgi:hypothetical protein